MPRRSGCLLALLLAGCAGKGDPKPAPEKSPARRPAPRQDAAPPARADAPAQGDAQDRPAPAAGEEPAGLPPDQARALEQALGEATPWALVALLADGAEGPAADALWARCEEELARGRLRRVEAWVAAEQLRRQALDGFQAAPLPPAQRLEARDSDYRKAWAVKGREAAKVELKKAHEKLAELRKTSDEQVAKQRERALEGDAFETPDGPAKLTDYEEGAFTVEVGGAKRTHGWSTCPPELGVAVRERATDPEDALQVFRLGLYALERGQFAAASQAFEQAAALNPALRMMLPDVERQERRTKLFRAPIEADGAETRVLWKFGKDDLAGLEDLSPLDPGVRISAVARQLQIKGIGEGHPLARVRGAWGARVTVEGVVTSVSPPPAIGFESGVARHVVAFDDRTRLYALRAGEGTEVAAAKVAARPGARVQVALTRRGDQLHVAVAVGDQPCFEEQVPVSGPVRLLVGGYGTGAARFAELSARGELDPSWAARTAALGRGRLPREVKGFELSLAARSAAMANRGALPPYFAKTSADDDVGLDGASDKVKELLTQGRRALMQGNQGAALQAFREASDLQPDVPVAAYLRGVIELRDDPQGALLWLDRAARSVADFYEAQAARAAARIRLGRLEAAQADLDAVEPLRVDFAPTTVARSDLAVALGRYDEAEDLIELAYAMSPADPNVLHRSARIGALLEGPGFDEGHRFHGAHTTLLTQDPEQWRPLVRRLRTLRELFEEVLAVLVGPQSEARGRVVVFAEREAYHAYQGLSCEGATDADALFDPWSNQLVAALPPAGEGWDAAALHAFQHEALHQWVHAQGVWLPPWLSEGLAEYAGALEIGPAGDGVESEGRLDATLREALHELVAHWDARVPLANLVQEQPSEFFAGNAQVKYAQAWTLVHYLLQGDDPQASAAFYRYVHLFAQLRGQPERATPGRALLAFALAETFGKLPSNSVTRGWERWVAKLAKDAGLPAPGG